MSNKWQVGTTYRLKHDRDFVSENTYANSKILKKIGLNDFTIVEINEQGRVTLIKTANGLIRSIDLDLLYFFRDSELQYFEIVLPNTQNNIPQFSNGIIVDWLDKLAYVSYNTCDIQSFDYGTLQMELFGGEYITGAENIVKYIKDEYNRLQSLNTQKKELQDKRKSLLDELTKLDKQLEDLQ